MKEKERTNNGLYSISQTVLPFAKSVLGKKGFVEVDILTNWEMIVGPELAAYSQPQKIEFKKDKKNDGILYLNVLSGAHSLELKHKEKAVLEKVNFYFGYNAVSGIKIMQNAEAFELEENTEVKNDKTLVTNEEENYITDLTSGVDNDDLRKTLMNLGKNIFNDNKGKNQDEI